MLRIIQLLKLTNILFRLIIHINLCILEDFYNRIIFNIYNSMNKIFRLIHIEFIKCSLFPIIYYF